MSEQNTIADSIELGEQLRESLDAAEAKLEHLPSTHPQRVYLELDKQIIRNNASVFDSDTEETVHLMRIAEAQAPRPKARVTAQQVRANQAVYDDLVFAVSKNYEDNQFLESSNKPSRKK